MDQRTIDFVNGKNGPHSLWFVVDSHILGAPVVGFWSAEFAGMSVSYGETPTIRARPAGIDEHGDGFEIGREAWWEPAPAYDAALFQIGNHINVLESARLRLVRERAKAIEEAAT
jgi:hypothetical protein